MTKLDFICLIPLLIIASAPIIIMLTITISRNLRVVYGFSLFMFLIAFLSLFFIIPLTTHNIDPLLLSEPVLRMGRVLMDAPSGTSSVSPR